MRFGILGPLQVVDSAGTPVVVPAAKQRIVLAALLLASGGTVSPARLAEALWDACPPPNAAAVMRTYVMRLRRVLGPAGARIVGQPAGLAVDLRDAGELDVAEVDLRWRAARAAATAGEWSRVSAELTTALSLWRGEPLADVPATRISPPRLRPWSRLTPRLLTITGADRQMPVPRQLPVSLPAFTSRAAELARLTELARQAAADGSAAISVISGMAGWARPRSRCTGRIR